MNEILKKIDEARNILWMSRRKMNVGAIAETIDLLNEAEKLIQAEQKEKTKGDVIRESNEALAEHLQEHGPCDMCVCHYYENELIYCNREMDCGEGILLYLNQRAEEK